MAHTMWQAHQAVVSLSAPSERACTSSSHVTLANSSLKGIKVPTARAASSAQRPRCFQLAVRADVNAVAEPAAPPPPVEAPPPLDSQPVGMNHPVLISLDLSQPSLPPMSKIIEADFLDLGLSTHGVAPSEAESHSPTTTEEELSAEAPHEQVQSVDEHITEETQSPQGVTLALEQTGEEEEAQEEPSSATVLSSFPEDSFASSGEDSDAGNYYEPVLELLAAAKVVPHPAKVEKGGEDAYLISDVGAGVLCVADGVGGWANDGVDPALYSKELVYHMQTAVENAECQEDLEPRELIRVAHSATKAEGAATAVVAVFDGERCALEVANLGDSGVMVVRNGEVVFKTGHQQHYFDCPYQLGSESSDSPDDAELYSVELMEGDTVVMGSDGLFDNVFDKDIACVVKVFGGQDSVGVQRMATALAALASKHAADPEYMSPYIIEAVECGKDLPVWEKMLGRKLSGGKLDDITVVVAQVVKSQNEEVLATL